MDSRLLTDLCQKLMLASQTTSELALNLLKNNQEIALALSRMLMNHAEEASSQQAPASQTSPAIPTAILNHLSSPPENLAKVPLNFLAFFAERGLLLKDCTINNSP